MYEGGEKEEEVTSTLVDDTEVASTSTPGDVTEVAPTSTPGDMDDTEVALTSTPGDVTEVAPTSTPGDVTEVAPTVYEQWAAERQPSWFTYVQYRRENNNEIAVWWPS